ISDPPPSTGEQQSSVSKQMGDGFRMDVAIGSHVLAQKEGQSFVLPQALVESKQIWLKDPSLWQTPFGKQLHFVTAIVLPVGESGLFLLMGNHQPAVPVTIGVMLEPVLKNFSRALALCRVNEAHTRNLEDDRQQALAELTRFNAALDSCQDAIFLIDPKALTFLAFNAAAPRMTGYSREELMSLGPTPLMADYDAKTLKNHFRQVVDGSVAEGGAVTWIRRKDGSRFPVDMGENLFRENDNQEIIIAIARDITERQRVEHRLRILSQAIEQAAEGVMITDRNGLIEYVNGAFTSLTGYPVGVVKGRPVSVLEMVGFDPKAYLNLFTLPGGEELPRQKWVLQRRDGSLHTIRMTVAPIRDESGRTSHFVSIHEDVTHQEILEDKLREAGKMEAISTLVGGIAHDFNNILTGITGNLFLVKEKTKDLETVQGNLDRMDRLTIRATDLVTQLSTFSRQTKSKKIGISANDLARDALKFTGYTLPENIQVLTRFPQETLMVDGDPKQLERVLTQLINNGCDALEGIENPEIRMELSRVEPDNGLLALHPEFKGKPMVRFLVADNGCGIAEENLGRIFDPFFTTKAVGKGTGLGLAMVYGAVKSHQGAVMVESNPGKGTVFKVFLPLKKAPPKSPAGA
ncbi:MAG: PAS domain S-box protein, partial [Deltaproteobacteria bacterium]|nr:PAS domain S-box protein [Deltaproteobacteria bacterium]